MYMVYLSIRCSSVCICSVLRFQCMGLKLISLKLLLYIAEGLTFTDYLDLLDSGVFFFDAIQVYFKNYLLLVSRDSLDFCIFIRIL